MPRKRGGHSGSSSGGGSLRAVASSLLSVAGALCTLASTEGATLRSIQHHRQQALATSMSAGAYGRPGIAQGTGECIGDLNKMCSAGQSGEMDYPVGLSKAFLEEACYDAQCRMCTDVAWTCELSFKRDSLLEQYNENPAYSEAFCRQYLARACEEKAKCCTGLREWVEDGLFPAGSTALWTSSAVPRALLPLPYCRLFNASAPAPDDGSEPPTCQACVDAIDVRFRISPDRCTAAFDPPMFFAPVAVESATTGEGMFKSSTQQCLKLANSLGSIAADLVGTPAKDFCACLGCCAPSDKTQPLCPYYLKPSTTA